MSRVLYLDSGAPTSVTSGSGAMGSWTAVWTPPVALEGFFVSMAMNPSGTNQVGLFDVGFGATPVSILNNGKDVFNNVNMNYLSYPISIPAGVPISIAAQETAGTAGGLFAHIIGVPKGAGIFPACSTAQMLYPSGGSNNFGPISSTSPGTLYGTTLNMPTKMIELFGEFNSSAGSSSSVCNLALTAGPSSTSQSDIISNYLLSLNNATTACFRQDWRVEIPPSQDIYLFLLNSTNVVPTGGLRVFY